MPSRHAVLAALLFILSHSCHAHAKLKVELFMEGECPSCRRFLKNIIAPLLSNGLLEWIDLDVVASGNAHKRSDGLIYCQHGGGECLMNEVVECTKYLSKDSWQWLPVVLCLEDNVASTLGSVDYVQFCSEKTGLKGTDIINCALGDKGGELFQKAYEKTQDLEVRHQWVPWLVVDNLPVFDSAVYLQQLICLRIPEKDRPDACFYNQFDSVAKS